jgi:hypothetical protein
VWEEVTLVIDEVSGLVGNAREHHARMDKPQSIGRFDRLLGWLAGTAPT